MGLMVGQVGPFPPKLVLFEPAMDIPAKGNDFLSIQSFDQVGALIGQVLNGPRKVSLNAKLIPTIQCPGLLITSGICWPLFSIANGINARVRNS